MIGRRMLGAAGLAATAATAGCSPVDLLNLLASQHLSASGLAYGPDARHRLDIYTPSGPGPYPVLMFLYGGSWDSGSREVYRFLGDAFAANGFLTVIPDYRLYPAVRYPGFLEDCARAFAWVRREAPHHGGMGTPWLMGHSAGAYNAAMLALAPEYLAATGLSPRDDIRGMIGLAGPYDFLPVQTVELRRIFGAAPDGMAPAATQPINHVDGHNPPLLLLAGAADDTVDPGNSARLAARVRAKGGFAEMRLYPGIDHREIIGAIAPALGFLAPTLRDCLAFMGQPATGTETG